MILFFSQRFALLVRCFRMGLEAFINSGKRDKTVTFRKFSESSQKTCDAPVRSALEEVLLLYSTG